MAKPRPDSTLLEVREWLSKGMDEGVCCPACEQTVKMYKRTIHATMARDLIRAYRAHHQAPFRPIDLLGSSSPDFVKLRYWGLLSEVDPEQVRDDGSPRTGRWSITAAGIAFIRQARTVQKYAHIYNGQKRTMSGDHVSIVECLGQNFSYNELMRA